MSYLRFVTQVVLLASLALFAIASSAQSFPSKPIRILTSAPGGGNDYVSRVISPSLSRNLGQQVIVDNRGALLAIEAVARAPGDGYTLLVVSQTHWIGPLLRKTSYDAVKDFAPIAVTVQNPVVLVVHPSLPVKSVKELVSLAKARPGELTYGSPAIGSANHMSAELFRVMARVNMLSVPYKGTGPATVALIGGHVHMLFPSPGGAAPHVKSGRLRALAVSSAKPSPLLPELPTIAEAVPGYRFDDSKAIFAPGTTPAAIVNQLSRAINAVVHEPKVKETFNNAGMEPVGSTPEYLAATIEREIAQLGKVIKDAGIRADNAQ